MCRYINRQDAKDAKDAKKGETIRWLVPDLFLLGALGVLAVQFFRSAISIKFPPGSRT
jgi:hypothetical protein